MSQGQLELATEYPPPGEDAYALQLAELLRKKVQEDYPTGITRRDAHAKHHGCVRAEFIVEPDLPSELRVGVFREPRTYLAWVRFSNQDGVPRPDAQKDIRGMAIKLMGVEGEKLLEDESSEQTQDLLLISHPVFVSRDVAEFYHLIEATTGGFLCLAWFFFNPFNLHWRSFRNLMASLQRHANPLEIRYWSTTPYRFGAQAVKYSARPQTAPATAVPPHPSPDFLKDALKQSLAKGEARFDFLVQFQTDPIRMPIEDPGVLWPEELSPFRKVATIRILQQEFDSGEQMAFGENISFTPWHSLPDHRPMGGINRARNLVYRIISEFRHQRNQTPRNEPVSWEPLSAGRAMDDLKPSAARTPTVPPASAAPSAGVPPSPVVSPQPSPVVGGQPPLGPSPRQASPQLWWNLAALTVFLVMGWLWLSSYTSVLDESDALWALNGGLIVAAVGWAVALIGRLVRKEWVEVIMCGVLDFMNTQSLVGPLVALLAVAWVVSLCFGGLELKDPSGTGGNVQVEVYRGGETSPTETRHWDTKKKLHTGCWSVWPWSGRALEIAVKGLPRKGVRLLPWWRAGLGSRLEYPSDFLRPVVLITGDHLLVGLAKEDQKANKPRQLSVTIDGKPYGPFAFDGHSVWVGCRKADALAVPESVRARWPNPNDPLLVERVFQPQEESTLALELPVGVSVTAVVEVPGQQAKPRHASVTTLQPSRPENQVQVLVLNYP